MKIKKPTKKTMINTAATGAGVVLGMKSSSAIESFVPTQHATLGKAGVVVLGAALALAVEGSGPAMHAVRGTGIGLIIDQGVKALDNTLNGKIPSSNKVLTAMFPASEPKEATKALAASMRARMASAINPSQYRMASPTGAFEGGYVAQ